ncbi:hypothetical protein Agub_g11005 [Astrephomene gubernaculifera]|uniref:CSD domain-containing protein n=1 Tax=Astrephomene gubernaculifera TaxID=47775 RepID=A0AAD3DVW7_9CHLO|nr:hypothetical protein Agub_g11005 [Astrephomene gubernaculifera]
MLPEACQTIEHGIVALLKRNFGFIACPNRVRDVFFHLAALEDCVPEQLEVGTTVTFTAERDSSGRQIATHVRLAPVGSRVRLVQTSQDTYIGQVADLATSTSKGVILFLNSREAPERILYDASDVLAARPTSSQQPPDATPSQPALASQLHADPLDAIFSQAPQPPLARGQLVLFRISTDMRAALLTQQATAAAASAAAIPDTAATAAGMGSPATACLISGGLSVSSGKEQCTPARPSVNTRQRLAYERAVEVRPVSSVSELRLSYPHLQHQAVLLELLGEAMRAAREVRAQAQEERVQEARVQEVRAQEHAHEQAVRRS